MVVDMQSVNNGAYQGLQNNAAPTKTDGTSHCMQNRNLN